MFPIMLPTPPVARCSVELSDVVLLKLSWLLDDIMKLKRRLLVDDDDLEDEDNVRTAAGTGALLFLI